MECTYDSRGRTRPTFVSLSISPTAKVHGALIKYPVCVWGGGGVESTVDVITLFFLYQYSVSDVSGHVVVC